MGSKWSKVKDPDERIQAFRQELLRIGYSKSSMWNYGAGAREYALTGREMTKEAIKEYFKETAKTRRKSKNSASQTGAMLFLKFINGEEIIRNEETISKRKKIIFHGCNDDCYNCPYDDCYKPVGECTSIHYEEWT